MLKFGKTFLWFMKMLRIYKQKYFFHPGYGGRKFCVSIYGIRGFFVFDVSIFFKTLVLVLTG